MARNDLQPGRGRLRRAGDEHRAEANGHEIEQHHPQGGATRGWIAPLLAPQQPVVQREPWHRDGQGHQQQRKRGEHLLARRGRAGSMNRGTATN